MKHVETICALASGPPPAALIVLRISGPACQDFLYRHVKPTPKTPRRASLVHLIDQEGEVVDEGLCLWMPGPKSYTGEDTIELTLHGGQAVLDHAMSVLMAHTDIRLAEPGEFTRRALESGSMDLTQAEAVADLIDAESAGQKQQALRQMRGAIGDQYRDWRGQVLDLMVLAESVIDFPDEEDAPKRVDEPIKQGLQRLIREFESALSDDFIGERIRSGFQIAILGAPNAGKSTLLNRLAKREAAIVSDIAGTTRDTLEVRLKLSGQLVTLVDTAGLRDTSDPIEQEGIRRAYRASDEADLSIVLLNGRAEVATRSEPGSTLFVWNKVDETGPDFDLVPDAEPGSIENPLTISGMTGKGVDTLINYLESWLTNAASATESSVITRARHRESLVDSLAHLRRALDRSSTSGVDEFVGEDLRLSARDLGCIIGDVGVEDVLGAIFSQFCIGK